MTAGMVFDIQKFRTHDGPGIRTVVFLKGCPMRCVWCHNPESWHANVELLFDSGKCSACGACGAACPAACHRFEEKKHIFDRDKCLACGACVPPCPAGALELCGESIRAEDVIAEVMKDRIFYENSGGGMTLSGGEPMAQFEFTGDLLELGKENGLHICMETCGFALQKHYKEILPLTDIFLFDIKTLDAVKHRKLTGQDNALILSNLQFLNDSGAQIYLRCPVVPGLNDSEAELSGIGRLADSLDNVLEIDIEPYHPLGISKAKRLGIDDYFEAPFTPGDAGEKWLSVISENTKKIVKIQ